jgi:hypothetical protein
MVEPVSIISASVGLAGSIASLIVQITQFISKVRDAQSDLHLVVNELESLQFALEFLQNDGEITLQDDVPVASILGNLEMVVAQISQHVSEQSEMRMTKRIRWAICGRDEVDKLRCSLEAYKSTLDIALDVLAL